MTTAAPDRASLAVSILVFDGVEVLDFAGPYEVFTTASRVYARQNPGTAPLFEVACVSRDGGSITARAGLRVLADRGFGDAVPCNLLVVPGGVVDAAMDCSLTRDWIARTTAKSSITASVCTGIFLLAASGVVQQQGVTTHWEDLAELQARFPGLEVVGGRRWIDHDRLVTSAGISAGIDMSIHLVSRLAGHETAELTARQMDYRWCMDDGA